MPTHSLIQLILPTFRTSKAELYELGDGACVKIARISGLPRRERLGLVCQVHITFRLVVSTMLEYAVSIRVDSSFINPLHSEIMAAYNVPNQRPDRGSVPSISTLLASSSKTAASISSDTIKRTSSRSSIQPLTQEELDQKSQKYIDEPHKH